MSSHRSRETMQPERVRIGGGGGPRASSSGARQPRQSWDVGQARLGRVSKTPSKGGNAGGGNFGGRMSRTPLKVVHRPRMSSLAGKGPESNSASDPRDIKSKAFQSSAISALIDFLSKKGFNQPLSRKVLSSPPTKEFVAIFEFIIQCFVPGYEVSTSGLKPDQEIFNVLRDLGYRYTLNKQHLATIGAPHTWPYALAALDWLREEVELNDHLEEAEDVESSLDDFEEDENFRRRKVLYRRNEARLYARYLNGEDEPDFSEFKAELDEVMMSGFSTSPRAIEALREECQALEEEIAQRRQWEDPLVEPKRRLEAAAKEEAARQAELKAELAKAADIQEEIAATRRSRDTIREKRAAAEEMVQELQAMLSKQTVRKEDVHRILLQRQQLQQSLAYQERVKLDLMEASGELERKIAGLIESTEPLAISLRRKAAELGLMDDFPGLQIGPAQMNNPESFVPTLRPLLEAEEERRKRKLEDERQNVENEKKLLDQVTGELRQALLKEREQQEQFDLLTKEVASYSERIHSQEEALMAERVAWDKKLFVLRNQATDLEKEGQLRAEYVRHASHQLRAFKEDASQRIKEKEATCRALTATALGLLESSQDFGAFLRSIGKDFMRSATAADRLDEENAPSH